MEPLTIVMLDEYFDGETCLAKDRFLYSGWELTDGATLRDGEPVRIALNAWTLPGAIITTSSYSLLLREDVYTHVKGLLECPSNLAVVERVIHLPYTKGPRGKAYGYSNKSFENLFMRKQEAWHLPIPCYHHLHPFRLTHPNALRDGSRGLNVAAESGGVGGHTRLVLSGVQTTLPSQTLVSASAVKTYGLVRSGTTYLMLNAVWREIAPHVDLDFFAVGALTWNGCRFRSADI